jgi:hypothetical protein
MWSYRQAVQLFSVRSLSGYYWKKRPCLLMDSYASVRAASTAVLRRRVASAAPERQADSATAAQAMDGLTRTASRATVATAAVSRGANPPHDLSQVAKLTRFSYDDAYEKLKSYQIHIFRTKMRFYRSSQSLRTRSGKKSMISIISHHLKTTTCHQSILLTKRRNKRQSLLHYTLLREIQRLTILPTRPPCSM